MSEFKYNISGVVLPPAEPIKLEGNKFEVMIARVDPENGYDEKNKPIPSENSMVKVNYPEGETKNHQCKDVTEMMGRISAFLQRRFALENFIFTDVPTTIKAGAVIRIEIEDQKNDG